MKQYVDDQQANAQINTIATLAEKGQTDEQIAQYLSDSAEVNLQYAEPYWTPGDIRKIRVNFGLAAHGRKFCPFCSVEIKAEALKCRHCHKTLPSVTPQKQSRKSYPDSEQHPAGEPNPNLQWIQNLLTVIHKFVSKKPGHAIAIAVGLIMIGMLLFPPYQGTDEQGVTVNLGYSFIVNPPSFMAAEGGYDIYSNYRSSKYVKGSVHFLMLLVQYIIVLLIGGIAYFFSKKE